MRTRISVILASFFGVGFFPFASGTAGTAAALPLLYPYAMLPVWGQLLVAAAVTVLCFEVAAVTGRHLGVVDASEIVLDEVAGLLVTFTFVPFTWQNVLAAFFLFRLFDITKPWPASYFDKKVKNGIGVTLDDIAAGVYARGALLGLQVAWPSVFESF